MNTIFAAASLSILASAASLAQMPDGGQGAVIPAMLPQEQRVQRFAVDGTNFAHAVAELSRSSVRGLHLGVEEIIGERYSDPDAEGVRFSLRLENRTVRETLDALCALDSRYTWSADGSSINVYPRATVGDATYLPNLRIERISLKDAADPFAVLGPLLRQHPEQQIGYAQVGGDPSYAEPWTVTFEHLTVRRLINKVAEHMGPQTSWSWRGIRRERTFSFFKGGYY